MSIITTDVNERTGLVIECRWNEDKTGAVITLGFESDNAETAPEPYEIYLSAKDFSFLARKFSEYSEKAITWRNITINQRGPRTIQPPPPIKMGL